MFKVIWKSFKYNRKNFLSFFMSEILSVAVIFMLIYIQEACKICQRHFDVKSLSCVDSKLSDHDDRRIYYIANIIRYQNEFRR